MRLPARWFVLAAAAAVLSACSLNHPSIDRLKLATRPPDPAQACADWRWIAVLDEPAAACPAPRSGWKSDRLFREVTPARPADPDKGRGYAAERADRGQRVVDPAATKEALAALSRFCVYQVETPSTKAKFPPVTNPHVVRLDQDCAALSVSSAPPIETIDWQPVAADFLVQSGKAPLDIKNQRGVRLAFLDTQPTGPFLASTPPGSSKHGFTLAHIARQLICDPPDGDTCAARITTRLALPLESFDAHSAAGTRNGAHGGYVGTQQDLARAIVEEVNAWAADLDKAGAAQHLVLNLSLAWDPELFAGLDESQVAELRAGSQAVYRALQYAASQDVLVFAAAGNKKDCPDVRQEGPMLPAAWEIGGPRDSSCGGSPRTLVYAVGALERYDRPLWKSREHSMPRRAAYGDNAVVPAGNPAVPTALYSGTSVATAVVSSIASIVWDTLPTRDSHGVMRLLDASGTSLDRQADFWPGVRNGSSVGGTDPKVRRLSLCETLRAACNESDHSNCPLPPSPCPPIPAAAVFSMLTSDRQLPDTCQPWLFPQPEDPPCPTCSGDPPRPRP